jgi:hypothetical protein
VSLQTVAWIERSEIRGDAKDKILDFAALNPDYIVTRAKSSHTRERTERMRGGALALFHLKG